MIDVLVVDDHPAVKAGLIGLMEAEPGLGCVAAEGTATDGLAAARRLAPAVVVADYELPDGDGLAMCCDLKELPAAPGVIVYSAFARPRLLAAAAIAGADAMLDKAVSPDELFETIRTVASGSARLPGAPPEVMERCLELLHPDDIPLFGMAVHGTPVHEIAAVVHLDASEVRRRLRALLGRLQDRTPGPVMSNGPA